MEDEFTIVCKKRLADIDDNHLINLWALMLRQALSQSMNDVQKYNKILAEMGRREVRGGNLLSKVFGRPLPDALDDHFGPDIGDGEDFYND